MAVMDDGSRSSRMTVCVPVTPGGEVGGGWGRAARVAVARVDGGLITSWTEHDVRWDELHDAAGEGSHHGRIASFLLEHGATMVIAGHMGPPMVQMLGRMGIEVRLGAVGDARLAVIGAG
jgi:predicted Fe-Mo cluster-binding NifX family protein